MCVNAAQQLFEYKNGSWHKLPGAGTHITIGVDSEKWVVNSDDNIYRMLPGDTAWKQIPGKLTSIHCTDENTVAGVNAEGYLFHWAGSGWTKLPGSGTHIGSTWGAMWVVNKDDSIYKRLT